MKKFFENYGFLAISAIVIALLIGMLTPVGFYIKNGVMALTGKFGDTTNGLVNGIDVNPYGQKEEEGIDDDYYITFSSPGSFTVALENKSWDGTVEYSTDAKKWTTYTSAGTAISSVDNKLYFRGKNNTSFSISIFSPSSTFVLTGSNISCSGNMETLLDHQTVANGGHPIMGDNAFRYMFRGCSSLVSAPELPATTLIYGCYYGMFAGCESLTTAPALPATTLADYCYGDMFSFCTSLTTAPALPATTMAYYCYSCMFLHCESLTTAPELPATTLAEACYDQMFSDCINLTVAPALPATTLADNCYQYMFSDCNSLTTAPALPATTLAGAAYNYMFYSCDNLTAIPAIQATEFSESVSNCCYGMFYDCERIKLSEEYHDSYTNYYSIDNYNYDSEGQESDYLYDMFGNTGGTFTGIPQFNTTYYLDESNSVVW